jgi:hypothetical protein
MSCNQNPSQTEKDYIKNLEEKNKALEKELHEVKSKTEPNNSPQGKKQKSKDYFTIGSTEEEVLEVMGDPTSYRDLGILGKRYIYGLSIVVFHEGKVDSYDNSGENLKVRVK